VSVHRPVSPGITRPIDHPCLADLSDTGRKFVSFQGQGGVGSSQVLAQPNGQANNDDWRTERPETENAHQQGSESPLGVSRSFRRSERTEQRETQPDVRTSLRNEAGSPSKRRVMSRIPVRDRLAANWAKGILRSPTSGQIGGNA
jgi:hypothetical protein